MPIPKYKVSDTLRISKYKSTFTKGYEVNFTEELIKIVKIIRGDPNVYELEDLEGESIIGKFYEEELSAVDKKDDVYRVKKILEIRARNNPSPTLQKNLWRINKGR